MMEKQPHSRTHSSPPIMSPSEAQHKHVTGRIGNTASPQNQINSSVSSSYDNPRNSSARLTVEEETNDPYVSSGGTYGSSPVEKISFEHRRTFWQQCCAVGFDWDDEVLKYNYNLSDRGTEQILPRTRERGEYYIDSYNMEKWNCTFGTFDEAGIWMNSGDQAGSVMAALVWLLMLYSAVTVTFLTKTEGIPPFLGMLYMFLVTMALAAHAKTSLTDPGSVPKNAVPVESQRRDLTSHSMCGQCSTFKPPMSHHCRICNRCVSRMDHHCPWMNNCVGAANFKHFILFLVYTWTCAAYALTLFGWNYFLCADEDCTFDPVVVHLVRIMTILCIGAFLFTSSMLMNVTYGILTGIGTIDRLKKKATNTVALSDEEPFQLKDIFGIAGYHTWLIPVDPVFEDYDKVMGYSMPSRLSREQQLLEKKRPSVSPKTISVPGCLNEFVPV